MPIVQVDTDRYLDSAATFTADLQIANVLWERLSLGEKGVFESWIPGLVSLSSCTGHNALINNQLLSCRSSDGTHLFTVLRYFSEHSMSFAIEVTFNDYLRRLYDLSVHEAKNETTVHLKAKVWAKESATMIDMEREHWNAMLENIRSVHESLNVTSHGFA